jgi:hypothetical protein
MVMCDYKASVNNGVAFVLPPLLVPRQLKSGDVTGLSKVMSAFLAADIREGRVVLPPTPSVAMLSRLLDVSVTYIVAASACTRAERQAVLSGERPLIRPDLGRAWSAADPATREQFAKTRAAEFGPEGLLDLAADLEVKHRNGHGTGNCAASHT